MKLLKNSTIFHIDMDAFYASVEQADQPELKGKNVIISGKSKRSVVSAASYEARRFGVRSAMPLYEALKKCPDAVVLPVRMSRYKTLSRQIMELLATFSPVMEQVSIDEAFLDATGYALLYDDAVAMAKAVKKRIQDDFHLTCSVGIAPVRFLAKIASDINKPNGITQITPHEVDNFIKQLPVEKVPGVGKRTFEMLSKLNIRFLGDVKKIPEDAVIKNLGKFGHRIIDLAQGIDGSGLQPHRKIKSVSSEETFLEDTKDMSFLKMCLLKHAEDVGRALRAKSFKAKTISIKIKHSDFSQITRSVTMLSYTQSTEKIFQAAIHLLECYELNKPVRLIGVTAATLVSLDHPEQMPLFGTEIVSDKNWEKVDHVLDAISEKFGDGMVKKAGLAGGRKKDENKT